MQKVTSVLGLIFLSKRAKSFYWRSGSAFVVGFLAYFADILPTLGLPHFALAFAVLLTGEVTKAANNYFSKKEVSVSQPQ